MLMISLALYLLVPAEANPWRAALAAIPVAVAYPLHPNNAVIGAAVTLYVRPPGGSARICSTGR